MIAIIKEITNYTVGQFKGGKGEMRDAVSLFVVSFLVVLVKSFFKERGVIYFNFFESRFLNNMFSYLAIPQVAAIVVYVLFFLFVFVLFLVVRIFSKDASFGPLLFSLMSISIIGIIAHIVTIPMVFIAKKAIVATSYIIYFLVVALNILSIKNSQRLPFVKAVLCFFIASLPFLLFGWFAVVSPYLIYLAV